MERRSAYCERSLNPYGVLTGRRARATASREIRSTNHGSCERERAELGEKGHENGL